MGVYQLLDQLGLFLDRRTIDDHGGIDGPEGIFKVGVREDAAEALVNCQSREGLPDKKASIFPRARAIPMSKKSTRISLTSVAGERPLRCKVSRSRISCMVPGT